ncbi:hypothetical protein ACFQZU_10755, partial [Streptomonospora algeriensis]
MSEDAAGDREETGGRSQPGGEHAANGAAGDGPPEPGNRIAVPGGEDLGALIGEILREDPADSRRRAGLLRRLAAALAA